MRQRGVRTSNNPHPPYSLLLPSSSGSCILFVFVFVFAFVFGLVFVLEATMPKRTSVFSGKSPQNVLEIYALMRLIWPNPYLLPVTYSFRHSIKHCDIKNVFIGVAEIKGCYQTWNLSRPSRPAVV